jgi:hypothetical protein
VSIVGSLLAAFALAAGAAPWARAEEPAAPRAGGGPLRVFIVAGQSNALGFNHVREYAGGKREFPEALRHQPDVLFWDVSRREGDRGDVWTKLGVDGSGAFGPELGFAHELNHRFPAARIAIIKYAAGGTGIARSADYADYIPQLKGFDDHGRNWHPEADGREAGALYRRLITTVRDALGALDQRGETWELAGLLWMQGEHEAGISPTMAEDYDTLLTGLMRAIRSDLEAPNLPVLIGEVNSHSWAFGDVVRREQAEVCRRDGHAVLVTTMDLSRAGSGGAAHFDADGMVELGIRFARVVPEAVMTGPP